MARWHSGCSPAPVITARLCRQPLFSGGRRERGRAARSCSPDEPRRESGRGAARRTSAWRDTARLTVRHTAYVNDLFSYQKEVLWNDAPCNLVRVLMANEGVRFEEAVQAIVSMVNRDVDRLLEIERAIPSWGPALDRQAEAYVDGMKAWIVGNVDFSLSSSRYRSSDSPFLELRSAQPRGWTRRSPTEDGAARGAE
ncbi:terpene synthase family protein [Sorangium sp. So ce131]|uniref:terpene synthase family protein n=1 Tax=Sorangium sp. So ce131 TaxID=3133282 RepID=UPI003F607CFC